MLLIWYWLALEFYQLFKENGLSLEIECNLKTVYYLDITLDLNTDTYKPSTLNPVTLQISLNNYLYQLKLDYINFPGILKFFMKHLNTIKMS